MYITHLVDVEGGIGLIFMNQCYLIHRYILIFYLKNKHLTTQKNFFFSSSFISILKIIITILETKIHTIIIGSDLVKYYILYINSI